MSSSNSPQKGFGALLGRIFGSDSKVTPGAPAANAAPELAPPARRFPKAPAPMVAPEPQVLTPRKGVGTVLRKAVHPGDASLHEPGGLWDAQAKQAEVEEQKERARPAKAPSRLLNLPRTVLSLLRKPAPPPKQIDFDFTKDQPAAAPTHDPALTRRKERDYPII